MENKSEIAFTSKTPYISSSEDEEEKDELSYEELKEAFEKLYDDLTLALKKNKQLKKDWKNHSLRKKSLRKSMLFCLKKLMF